MKRLQYSEQSMRNAIDAVRGGMPKKEVADIYSIPRTTLINNITKLLQFIYI